MRAVVRLAVLSAMVATTAFGQRFGGGFVGGRGFGGAAHFGFRSGGFHGFVGGGRFGFFRPVHPFPFRTRLFFPGRPFFGTPFGFPSSFPVYVGGYGYPFDYGQPVPSAPNVTILYMAPPAGPETVYERRVEETPRPALHEYGQRSEQVSTKPSQIYFWIARKDRSVDRAAAFWVDRDTLHYIDLAGARKEVPLEEVDATLSRNLNQAIGIEFRLPAPGSPQTR